MKTCLTLALVLAAAFGFAQEKPGKNDRLISKDSNKDGKLSKEELGEQFWQRAAGQDANGDGLLDAQEIAALQSKARGKGTPQARPGGANAAFTVREFKGSNGHTIRYSLFVPEKSETPLPLVLCLHGAGGNTTAANVLAAPEMQQKHACIVMAPACDGKSTRWVASTFRYSDARPVMPELMEALEAVITETKADRTRLYITGQSMGGIGSWGIIASHADKFAAAVPVCGIWEPSDAPKMNGVPIWAFHGADDKTVPVSGSRDMIAALKKAEVKPEPKYTEFPGVGHGSWEPAYQTAELWEWLFVQKKIKP
ncbi:prolyl oligopeptidase family serine peptidase [Brevifollis gellanilyticus]|nr:prolyl oligopeptidase family serine peptidase [Brevifollis gellanilyticus]